MNTVVRIVQIIVDLRHAVKVMEVAIHVLMAGMVKYVIIRALRIVKPVTNRLVHARYVMLVNGENFVLKHVI